MSGKYDDIINLPHHQSDKHTHMSIHNRAAQFAPFAALTGHDAAIRETSRQTDKKTELEEYERAEIDKRLQIIADSISDRPEVTVTYFVPDEKKQGGKYVTYTGNIRRIDEIAQLLIMSDKSKIQINDILDITGELIPEWKGKDYEY